MHHHSRVSSFYASVFPFFFSKTIALGAGPGCCRAPPAAPPSAWDRAPGPFRCRYLFAASRDEMYPPGIWVIMYPQKNEPWIMPTVSGSQLNFAFFQCKAPGEKERKRRGRL